MGNKNGGDFLIVVAVLVCIYYVIREIAPLCKEVSVEQRPDDGIKFSAFTHDKEEKPRQPSARPTRQLNHDARYHAQ